MRLIVKSPVWDDLREIGLCIAADNSEAAVRFFAASEEQFEMLRRHPGIGRLRSFSLEGVRSWLLRDFENYIVFYLQKHNEVQILAVLHGARDFSMVLTDRLK